MLLDQPHRLAEIRRQQNGSGSHQFSDLPWPFSSPRLPGRLRLRTTTIRRSDSKSEFFSLKRKCPTLPLIRRRSEAIDVKMGRLPNAGRFRIGPDGLELPRNLECEKAHVAVVSGL